MRHKSSDELKEAREGMPVPVPDCEGVYHCGFHSELSFGATSYLITRPEGNILMDAPRFNPLLAKKFQELGGVKYIVLSHTCAFSCPLGTLHLHVCLCFQLASGQNVPHAVHAAR